MSNSASVNVRFPYMLPIQCNYRYIDALSLFWKLISDPDQVVVRKCSADDDTHHGHISLDHHPDLFRSTARSKHKSTDKLPPEFQRKIDIIEPDDLDGEIIQAKPDEPSIASNLFSYLVYKPDSEEARVYADRIAQVHVSLLRSRSVVCNPQQNSQSHSMDRNSFLA